MRDTNELTLSHGLHRAPEVVVVRGVGWPVGQRFLSPPKHQSCLREAVDYCDVQGTIFGMSTTPRRTYGRNGAVDDREENAAAKVLPLPHMAAEVRESGP